MTDVLVEEVREGVTLLSLNRPETLNSMTLDLVGELNSALAELAADPACRVIVLTGKGRGFSSGHDLGEMQESEEDRSGSDEGFVTVPTGMYVQEAFASLTTRMQPAPQPIIAAVNGPAAGGGLALALAADTRVCAESARFNAAFVRIGLSGCDMGVSYLLPRLVGPTLAFEMMLTGRLIDADEAERAGLVLRVVPDGQVVDAAMEIAVTMTANSPFGVRLTKEVMWTNLEAASLQSAIALEHSTQNPCVNTEDQPEAIIAVGAKRSPRFANR